MGARKYHVGPFRFESRAEASPWFLLPMILVIAAVAALVVYEFSRFPLPPGVDPGHWLSASYGYVGLPTAPDPANRPLLYSPLMFPALGALVWMTSNPPLAASILAIALLVGYGLSVAHLARRYLRSGVLQVGLVGLAMACGTTLQMMFWGAYPNYLGFILMNESMIFLLLYIRDQKTRDGVLFYTVTALTYLAHDLTFMILVAVLAVSAILLLVFGRMSWRFLVDRRNIAGVAGLVGVVEGYGLITARLGISHPSYFYSNSSAYYIDHVGEIFSPLGHAPAFTPSAGAVFLAPGTATVLLLAVPLLLCTVLLILRWFRPTRLDHRVLITVGWLSAAAAVPALGYLVRIQTDYVRFLYFLPLPLALLGLLAFEEIVLSPLPSAKLTASPDLVRAAGTRSRLPRRVSIARESAEFWTGVTLAVILMLVFTNVTIPVAQASESSGASVGHDSNFVAAAMWLRHTHGTGNVLTDSSVARWTEALSNRQTFTVGPVWLLFDPFQIVSAQEAYWALNSEYAVTDGRTVLSYSGSNTTAFNQAPLYTAYDQGIPFPVFRVLPGAIKLDVTTPNGTQIVPAAGSSPPILQVRPGPNATGTILYQSAVANVWEIGQSWGGGHASIAFRVVPAPGTVVHSLSITLARPPTGAPALTRDSSPGPTYANSSLHWGVTGSLGQYPTPATLNTTIQFSESPGWQGLGSPAGNGAWTGVFPDPNGSSQFDLVMNMTTPGTSNPDTSLPAAFSTASFLADNSIHFLLWRNGASLPDQAEFYRATFGYQLVYNNPSWQVWEG